MNVKWKTDYNNAFEDLKQYQQQTKDWLFGYLSYDLKNGTEELYSNNFDGLHFPDLFFFQPKKLFLLKGNQLEVQYLRLCDDEIDEDFTKIFSTQHPSSIIQHPIINANTELLIDFLLAGTIFLAERKTNRGNAIHQSC